MICAQVTCAIDRNCGLEDRRTDSVLGPELWSATISVDECLELRTGIQVPSLISGDYYIIFFFHVSHVVAVLNSRLRIFTDKHFFIFMFPDCEEEFSVNTAFTDFHLATL